MNDNLRDSPQLPVTVRFAQPWLADNQHFITVELTRRSEAISSLREKYRPKLLKDNRIKVAPAGKPFELAAVDASVHDIKFDDISLLLVQAALHYRGHTDFDEAFRYGPLDNGIVDYLRTPARSCREVILLSKVQQITIADNSLWSILMELNMAITALRHADNDGYKSFELKQIVDNMTAVFLPMIKNKHIIAMPKRGLAHSFINNNFDELREVGISDREFFSLVLNENEYLRPTSLSEAGEFGIQRDLDEKERAKIQEIYNKKLVYIYYRPWSYQKAYRVEGYRETLDHDLLASIRQATSYRGIAEPLPQFYVDHAVKQLGGIQKLYGVNNRFRSPVIGFHRTSSIGK